MRRAATSGLTQTEDDFTALHAAAKRMLAREGPALRNLQDVSAVQAVDVQLVRSSSTAGGRIGRSPTLKSSGSCGL